MAHVNDQRDRQDATAAEYRWGDAAWMRARAERNSLRAPMSIYQVDLGSWRGKMSYRELAPQLADYLQRMNFTHAEFPADAETSADSQDLLYVIDLLHQRGVGIVLDFSPRLLRSEADALAWIDHFHADAIRISAIESLLYLDHGRKPGEWTLNEHGGRENLEGLALLRRMNEKIYAAHPDVQTIAEESTAWPMVSRPTYAGGLGFGLKWDVGWTHDTLEYFRKDPIHRRFHHGLLTFRGMYMFNENYVLPLSWNQEKSLYAQMPGDEWRKFANLRLLYGYMFSQPGKKLLFMGDEFGQRAAWNPEHSLDWHLLDQPAHAGLQRWVEDLNKAYRMHPAFFADDFSRDGFEWIDANDAENSVLSYLRRGSGETAAVVCNFTPEPRYNYRIGVPHGGFWRELLNCDATLYGGSGQGNMGGVEAAPVPFHGRSSSLVLTLPPLGIVVFAPEGQTPPIAAARG